VHVGYFKGIAAGSFKTDAEGRSLFFPCGVLARGRVLDDPSKEERVRKFVTRYNAVGILGSIGVVISGKWILLAAFLPVMLAWYYFGVRALVGDCAYSEDTLTVRDAYANAAVAHNAFTLWLLLVASVLFVAGGAFMAVRGPALSQRAIGAFAVLFFGAGVAASWHMLKVRRSTKASRTARAKSATS
jgi:hypothetical protein